MKRKRVLFLCTGNSARSQMAEGLVNHFLAGRWEAFSAGTAPAGRVHPLAVQAMAELGVDISAQRPKPVDEFQGSDFDLVITLCDGAAQSCPLWLGQGRSLHIGFPDPAGEPGSEAERLESFRRVRDDIRARVFARLEGSGEEGKAAGMGFPGDVGQQIELFPWSRLPGTGCRQEMIRWSEFRRFGRPFSMSWSSCRTTCWSWAAWWRRRWSNRSRCSGGAIAQVRRA